MLRLSSLLPAAALACLLATPALAEVRVLTSIKPLQLIAAAVQDGLGEPDVLLPPGASPHEYALRPSDMRRLREVDLFYWVGPDLEVFLPRVLEGRPQPSLALQTLDGLHLRHFGTEAAPDAEVHAAAASDEHDQAHRPGSLDAHLWLAPGNARTIAARMAADLAAADPTHAARYRANLAAFEQRLAATDAKLKARLAPLAAKPFFVFHEAFDYFEEAYGLQHTGVFAVSAEVQPGARHVAAMRERLQAAGPSCVFSEPPLRPRLAQTLSEGLPVRLAELDALGFDLPAQAGSYEQLLERLGDGLAGCLEQL
ncbi:MAG TPA: zinc ABC transporter substrate-binding protein [Pseudomonas sp.]|nr:zinc ABC transporter substrate-binding protein [Pseudomonas sp.]